MLQCGMLPLHCETCSHEKNGFQLLIHLDLRKCNILSSETCRVIGNNTLHLVFDFRTVLHG